MVFAYSLARLKVAYIERRYLLTRSERVFYLALSKAYWDEYVVFSKVRIADVLTPPTMSNKKKWWRLFTQISSKHVDFVLCAFNDQTIVCWIALDPRSHWGAERRKRKAFVNKAFDVAALPRLRVATLSHYGTDELLSLKRSRV
ncbi:MAG: DUF2726 domain-containing protein [Pseudomonadota bacterium]